MSSYSLAESDFNHSYFMMYFEAWKEMLEEDYKLEIRAFLKALANNTNDPVMTYEHYIAHVRLSYTIQLNMLLKHAPDSVKSEKKYGVLWLSKHFDKMDSLAKKEIHKRCIEYIN
jgi:hypothetical protein